MSEYDRAKLLSLISGLSHAELDKFVKHSLRTSDDGFEQELLINGLWYKRKLRADGSTESLKFIARDFGAGMNNRRQK